MSPTGKRRLLIVRSLLPTAFKGKIEIRNSCSQHYNSDSGHFATKLEVDQRTTLTRTLGELLYVRGTYHSVFPPRKE